MKKILWIFSSALLLSVGFFSTGCGGDDEALAPTVSISDEPVGTTFVVGDVVSFTVTASKGTDPLKAITFYQNGTKVNVDDLLVDGASVGDAAVLIVDPQDEMTWNVDITLSSSGEYDFSVKVEDTGNLSAEASFSNTIVAESPIEESLTGILFNQAGPPGTGGLDLDTGAGTGSAAAQSEIRDMGIDSLAGSGDNWRRRIGGINGVELRFAGNNTVEFNDIASKEAIESIWDSATDFSAANTYSTGNIQAWGNYKVSDTVSIGDTFVAYKSSENTYYLIVVTDIEEDTALGNNDDNYTLSIKF